MDERDGLLNEMRRRELLHQAASRRLVREARLVRRDAVHVYAPLLLWAGRRLIVVGFRLLLAAREWEYRTRNVYNGVESLIEPLSTDSR